MRDEVRAEPQIGVGGWVLHPTEEKYVLDALRSGRLTYGPYTREFERQIAAIHSRRHALFCNSGTSALQAALHALKSIHGWRDGDEVIVPALTFVATINVVLQNRLKPVLVDVHPEHFDLNPAALEAAVGERTRAVMPVHICGQPADMDPIVEVARAGRLVVLEDSCEAMFVKYRGRPVGSFGDAACFSTYMAHIVTTGVGGLAVCDDDELAVKVRSLLNHGRDGIYVAIDDDATSDRSLKREIMERRFSFADIGYSYRATELEAAIGVAQLERADDMLGKRQANAAALTAGLMDLSDYLALPSARPGSGHAWMMFPIVVNPDRVARDELLLHLEMQGIETRFLLPLVHQPVYQGWLIPKPEQFPVADYLSRNAFYIGCHPQIEAPQLSRIVDAFHSFEW